MSFSGYKLGPSRGRGGYRGNRGGGGSSSSWGRGGKSFSPVRNTRGGWHRSSESYERTSAPRYADDERSYQSRGSRDDSYRRYSQEGGGYSSMEVSHHRSPEPVPRKRLRQEHPSTYHQATSHHRSSGDSYHEYSSSARYNEYESDKPTTYYREERKSSYAQPERYHHRDEYRKEEMPPPTPPLRRTSYRGVRGVRGSRGGFRKTTLLERRDSMKKKILSSRTSLEHLRKLRLRSHFNSRLRSESPPPLRAETNNILEPRSEENWDEIVPPKVTERDETSVKKEVSDTVPEKVETKTEAESTEVHQQDSNNATVQVTIKQDVDGRAVNEDSSPVKPKHRFIRLQCPHCYDRCVTFKQYTAHLYSTKHRIAMSRLMMRNKLSVQRLRQEQRKLQREEEEKNVESLAEFSSFCPVCKLNYRQSRATHSASKMHQEMKKFLFPYCKVCGIAFKATLLYNKHICSLDHIRREAYMEDCLKQMDGHREKEVDLDEFMIVDSVGDVDDADVGVKDESKQDVKEEEKKEKYQLVGLEFLLKVEALYCELCQRYLPRLDDTERAKSVHCRSSQHLRIYREQRDSINKKNKEQNDKNEVPTKDEKPKVVKEVFLPEKLTPEEKLWRDVDRDLGELIRTVAEEPSDDEETAVGRYDRFRYTKSGEEKSESEDTNNKVEDIVEENEKI